MIVDFTDEETKVMIRLLAGEIGARSRMGQPTKIEIGISAKLQKADKNNLIPDYVDPKYVKPACRYEV